MKELPLLNQDTLSGEVTFVVIGKNEAKILPRCFSSILKLTDNIIFVDSDSTDNSVGIAKEFGIKKIIRVKANYHSASLARSVGADDVYTKYIQFLDGDMALETDWISYSLNYLENNKRVATVNGYKKVYNHDFKNFFIHSDKKDWQPDYLGGAFLIRNRIYREVGGFDIRFHGEEERDLYVRLRDKGYQVWYLHKLMSSHYDFKTNNYWYILFSGIEAGMWVSLLKSIKNRRIKSYIFVYRTLLIPLLCEIITFSLLLFGIKNFLFYGSLIQIFELLYCSIIKRPGYFLIWKGAILSIKKSYQILKRKVSYNKEYINIAKKSFEINNNTP